MRQRKKMFKRRNAVRNMNRRPEKRSDFGEIDYTVLADSWRKMGLFFLALICLFVGVMAGLLWSFARQV